MIRTLNEWRSATAHLGPLPRSAAWLAGSFEGWGLLAWWVLVVLAIALIV